MADLITLGWREWVGFPNLGLTQIKAKVDTGARTSALHAFKVTPVTIDGKEHIEFYLHPNQRDLETVKVCTAPAIDQRVVTDSGGHKEERWVISTSITIGDKSWPIEMTLTSRDDMLFRMLLGRNAIKGRALVDPSRSYLVGKRKKKR